MSVFLAEYYGVSERKILECARRVQISTSDVRIGISQIIDAIVTVVTDKSTKSMFKFLRSSLTESSIIDCDDKTVTVSGSFSFQYIVEEDGVINAQLSFPTSRGKLIIGVNRGILDKRDVFQKINTFLEIGTDESFEPSFRNDNIFRWTEISVEHRFMIESIPGLADALDDKIVDVIVSEIILFGRYIRYKCQE